MQNKIKFYPKLAQLIQQASEFTISEERVEILSDLIEYIQNKVNQKSEVQLNFICTHNSRRSQFSQVWAYTLAKYFGLEVQSFSGGVEITECNSRTIASLKRSGFEITSSGKENPTYSIHFSEAESPILAYSKLYDDSKHPKQNFAAIMTCSHADEHCPVIHGADTRIPLRYEDPKLFDDTNQEAEKYDERSLQIASELYFVMSKIQQ